MLWLAFALLTLATLALLLLPLVAAPGNRTAAIVIAVTVPVFAGLLYASLGHPFLPGAPYAERSVMDWADIGENQVAAAGGLVDREALAAFIEALRRDPREPRARFFVGFAAAETGDLKIAVAIWRDLEKDSKPDAPWLPILRRNIALAAKMGKFDADSVPPAPPSPQQLAAILAALRRTER